MTTPSANVAATAPTPSSGVALRDQIADRVREDIIQGRIPSGTRLREDDLARDHGASRLPVREALTRLASEGFVTLERFRGATVPAPSARMGLELIQIRRAMETLAAELAARAKGGAYADELAAVAAHGTELVQAEDFAAIPPLVEQFHELVAKASGNEQLRDMLATVRSKTSWLFAVNLPTRAHPSWSDHAEIAAAIANGFSDLATALMDRHIRHDEELYRQQLTPEQ